MVSCSVGLIVSFACFVSLFQNEIKPATGFLGPAPGRKHRTALPVQIEKTASVEDMVEISKFKNVNVKLGVFPTGSKWLDQTDPKFYKTSTEDFIANVFFTVGNEHEAISKIAMHLYVRVYNLLEQMSPAELKWLQQYMESVSDTQDFLLLRLRPKQKQELDTVWGVCDEIGKAEIKRLISTFGDPVPTFDYENIQQAELNNLLGEIATLSAIFQLSYEKPNWQHEDIKAHVLKIYESYLLKATFAGYLQNQRGFQRFRPDKMEVTIPSKLPLVAEKIIKNMKQVTDRVDIEQRIEERGRELIQFLLQSLPASKRSGVLALRILEIEYPDLHDLSDRLDIQLKAPVKPKSRYY